MSMAPVQDLLDRALELPPRERAHLAYALLASLDDEPKQDVELAWRDEIERRARAAMSDGWQGEDWSVVRERTRPR